MTEQEVIEMLAANEVTYPYAYKNMTDENSDLLLKVWYQKFKNYDGNIVRYSFDKCLEYCKMPVTIADVFSQLRKIEEAQNETAEELWTKFLDAASKIGFWNQCYKGTCNSDKKQKQYYNDVLTDIYGSLDKATQLFCGNVRQLVDYGEQGRTELIKYVKPNFMKRIEVLRERAKTISETPNELMRLSEQTANKLLEEKR